MALSPERIQELNDKYGVKPAGTAQLGARLRTAWGIEKPEAPRLSETVGSKVAGEWMGSAEKIGESVKLGAEKFAAGEGVVEKTGALLETGLGVASGAVRSIFAPLTAVIAEGMERTGATDAISALADTETAQKVSKWAEENPDVARNLGDILNVATAGLGQKLGGGVLKTSLEKIGKEVVEEGVRVGKEAVETISSATGRKIDDVIESRIVKAKENVDETIGRIVQGKVDDIEKAKRALSDIDTSGVKTYEELNVRLDDSIDALSRKLDEFLDEADTKKGALSKEDLSITSDVGGTIVKQDFVKDAIDHLEEMYTQANDAVSATKIKNLRSKIESSGITRKELNALAKEYGRSGGKAFNPKTGEPLTSINAQSFENTRKGIKETFRRTIEGDVAKTLDSKISDLLETRRLTTKMEERVNALWQKVQKRGVLEKAARGLADVVNVATFNTLSGFLARMLPSNVGLKTMNALDIEKELAKNLSKIEELLKTQDDALIVKGIEAIIRATPQQ